MSASGQTHDPGRCCRRSPLPAPFGLSSRKKCGKMIMGTVSAVSSSSPIPRSTSFRRPRRGVPTTFAGARHAGGGVLSVLELGLSFRCHGLNFAHAAASVSKIRALQGEDEIEVAPSLSELEEEVYYFMVRSARPGSFPTREELVAAGRADLAVAIVERGGWLALGWDSEEEESQNFYRDCGDAGDRGSSSSTASSSGRSLDSDWDEEDAGIHGISNRQKKLRSVSHGLGDGDNCGLRRPGIFLNSKSDARVQSILKDSNVGYQLQSEKLRDDRSGRTDLFSLSEKSSQYQMNMHLQHLQSKLNSTLGLLRSTNSVSTSKSQGRSKKQSYELSDVLEFHQTEIIKAHDNLRSIRTKLAVIEGNMSVEIGEAEKLLEEKQKRINSMESALQLLCVVCIVWPHSASEVILVGSFDGWTSQRRMERSSTGIFTLYLKLYPGRYEASSILVLGPLDFCGQYGLIF